ncbi:unnamed protein product, partial [Prorocentrum cordatum]
VEQMRIHDSGCTTMDLRFADGELIVVSEAPRGSCPGTAGVQVVDFSRREVRQRIDVSDSTINCCDVARGQVCMGSSDSKVRLLRRAGSLHGCGGEGSGADAGYREVCAYECPSEVNDLRMTFEDAVVTVRTYRDRHPAGVDILPLERPSALVSFPGGSGAMMGKYIHALDGFEEGCSLSSVVCTGEDPSTSASSVMLFDFRRQSPCVVDMQVAAVGQPPTSMLWPLRAGPSPLVYAAVELEGLGSKIVMVDFRYPTIGSGMEFCFPGKVDDFRCFGGSLYVACAAPAAQQTQVSVFRCSPGNPQEIELLSSSMVGAGSSTSSLQSPHEDLRVLTVSQGGFAFSCGEHLLLGSVVEAWRPGRLPPTSAGLPPAPLPL